MKMVRFILGPFLLFHTTDLCYFIFLNLKNKTKFIVLIFASERMKLVKLDEFKQSLKLRSNKIFLNFKKFNHSVITQTKNANPSKIISPIKLISTLVFQQNLVANVLIESAGIRSFKSSLHFPAFGLNTEKYGVSFRIQSKCGKMWTRITPNSDTFYAVFRMESFRVKIKT